MSWVIYILYSENFKKSYVGCTKDINTRLKSHNAGKVISTKKYVPWKIVYSEEVGSQKDALKRERYFKSSAGRRKMKLIFDELKLNN